MNPTRRTSRSRVATVLVAAALVAVLAGCSVGGSTTSTAQRAGASTAGAASTSSVRIVLRFDDDLGQSVPPPGLTRLGSVDSGLEGIARAGNRFTVRIELDDGTSS